jgi:mono/diheme cytochrome c family protein
MGSRLHFFFIDVRGNRMNWAKFCMTVIVSVVICAGTLQAQEAIPEVNPFSGDAKAIKSGKSWFRNTCSPCHGGRADGMGDMGTGADLRKLKIGFKRYYETVKHGRKVQGRAQFMPSFSFLDDKTIFEIGAYVETLAIEGANWKEGVTN